eukprot:2545083-Amphidinium_carterae.1
MTLKILQDVYTWVKRHAESRHRLRPLPPGVRDELLGMLATWTDLECQLRTAPSKVLFASDASQTLAGIARADLALDGAVLLWSMHTQALPVGGRS